MAGPQIQEARLHLLGISVKTADTHRTRVMGKLDAHSVVGLVAYAIRASITRP